MGVKFEFLVGEGSGFNDPYTLDVQKSCFGPMSAERPWLTFKLIGVDAENGEQRIEMYSVGKGFVQVGVDGTGHSLEIQAEKGTGLINAAFSNYGRLLKRIKDISDALSEHLDPAKNTKKYLMGHRAGLLDGLKLKMEPFEISYRDKEKQEKTMTIMLPVGVDAESTLLQESLDVLGAIKSQCSSPTEFLKAGLGALDASKHGAFEEMYEELWNAL